MQLYNATVSHRLIYVFTIPDQKHEGCLKIGETGLESGLSHHQLPPNCEELNQAARDRIDEYTKTALIDYELLHTELARRYVQFEDGTEDWTLFRDDDVHNVLYASGYAALKFASGNRDSEWFRVGLPLAKLAIQAVKEGRRALTAEEIASVCGENPQVETPPGEQTPAKAFTLRREQRECVDKTRAVFRKGDEMLWNCKMRFGKTVTAYSLIKEENYRSVIVVTHRPAVVAGWHADFELVFGKDCDRAFHSKAYTRQEDLDDAQIDADNDRKLRELAASGKPFVYFASVQDLRHSAPVGGKYNKNNAVFETGWDLIIYDEAHEGTQTELGQSVQAALESAKNGKKPKILSLSGTPYNIIEKYGNNVYSWGYVDEQTAKRDWDAKHPGDHNPYADLPEMRILTFDMARAMETSYRYETYDAAFNFTEFFRVWTGDTKQDFRPLPAGAKIGDFVHEDDVIRFLNLITAESADSGYPFATPERREMFRHTFWMVPGVKAARALSVLLRNHPVFRAYQVANVAGDGDEEIPFDNALQLVKDTIQKNPYSITISCGRLTTGVTVPEWTAVMMLTGSANTSAASYMQTIFRVQSAGIIDGKRKERCYVFDFAPDRALKVLLKAHELQKRGRRSDGDAQGALGEFLNFCPVLSYDGTRMTEYDVPRMMRQIKRMTVDKAIKSGFDDESVYKSDTGIVMNQDDVSLINTLGDVLTPQKQAKRQTKVVINSQGLTGEEYEQAERAKRKPKRELSPEEQALLDKLKAQEQNKKKVIALLRNISIRLPLLIYGADADLTENIGMSDFIRLTDDESWKEFMPKGVTKELFRRVWKYYDEDVVIGAGLRIRRMAKAADELPPTRRVQQIAEIFQTFRNPDKETVLTPWRVVNMHLSDTLGGYCFLNEQFDAQNPLDAPRLVERDGVTAELLLSPSVKILEMNSKSGLYPLYMAYSLYAMRLSGNEDKLPLEQTRELWKQVVQEHIFVLCRTKMARFVTRRTLAGYQGWAVNTACPSKLLERMRTDMKRLARKLTNPATWGKEGERLKFNAIVGNPPYQESDGGNNASATPVYNYFVEQAKEINPHYLSMITPAKWYSGGKGLDTFRANMLNDKRIRKIVDFTDSKDCFPTVDIAGGVCYFLWDNAYDGKCEFTNVSNGKTTVTLKYLNGYDTLIRYPVAEAIVNKVLSYGEENLSGMVSARKPFGLATYVKPTPTGDIRLRYNGGTGYFFRKDIPQSQEWIDKWKVIISRLSAEHAGQPDKNGQFRVLSTTEILPPNTACTETYLVAGVFDSEAEANHYFKYLQGKFARFLLAQIAMTQQITKFTFSFVPVQDFSKPWTDAELYEKYGLTADEIAFVEAMIKPME